jgi:hypothetical protein
MGQTVTLRDGQTLFDVAIQEYGTTEAAVDIAWQNDLSLTDAVAAGTLLSMPRGLTVNRTMQVWCREQGVSPATARDAGGVTTGVFTPEFTEEFD